MEESFLRTVFWQGEIPFNDCCDDVGSFDCDSPMAVVFNVIPQNKTTEELVKEFKRFGGLKASARCVGSHIGTVASGVSREVSLSLSDHALTSLLESMKTQPDGFVIYDLSKTELFPDTTMWNALAQDAPQQCGNYLYLAMCYSFPQAVDALEKCIQRSFQRRRRVSWWIAGLAPLTCGVSCLIGDFFQKKYILANKRPLPVDIQITSRSYVGIALNRQQHFVF